MVLQNVQNSLDHINLELQDTEERREKLIKGTRDINILCSKSIVSLHNNETEAAKNKIEQAKHLLNDFKQYARTDLHKYLAISEQELVEAYCLYSVVGESILPEMKQLNVSGSSYITGLLDCIGEMKRIVYDKIMAGKAGDATKLFAIMQDMYNAIYPFAVYDNLVSGLRRKLDIAKILIEDVRSVITEETRRELMIKAINKLEEKLPENR